MFSFFFLLGFLVIMSSSCDMLEKLFSSLFDKGNVIFISCGLGLSDNGSDIFLLIVFSDFSIQFNHPLFYSLIFFYFRPFSSLLLSLLLNT